MNPEQIEGLAQAIREGLPAEVDLLVTTEEDIAGVIEAVRQAEKRIRLPLIFNKHNLRAFHRDLHCQRCGLCCNTGPQTPGDKGIMLLPKEHKRIARLLGVSVKGLRRMSIKDEQGVYHLQYPCPFYDEVRRRCRIYPERPYICRLFPVELSPEEGMNHIDLSSYCPAARKFAVQFYIAYQQRWKAEFAGVR